MAHSLDNKFLKQFSKKFFTPLGLFLYQKEGQLSRSLVLLSLSLSCGIAALVALETFSRRVENTVTQDSRKVLAADFQVRAWRPFDEKVWEALAEEKAQGYLVLLNDFVSTISYEVAGEAKTSTVSVRAIEGDAYPFYGNFITEPAAAVADLSGAPFVFIDSSFRARGLVPGMKLSLGNETFTVRALIMEEPQSATAVFSLGPRIIISKKYLASTGLVDVGSRVFNQLLVKSPLSSKEFEAKFRSKAPDLHWRITTPEKANRQVERVIDRMRGFLSFVGVASLFLGTMGLFMVFRSQFLQRLPSYLTLRCLGASHKSIVQVAVLNSLQVAFLGSLLGVLLGLAFEAGLAYFARRYFGVTLAEVSWWPAFGWGFLLSFLCVGLSVFLPLREILRIPVSNAIREQEGGASTLHFQDGFVAFCVAILIVFLVAPGIKMSFFILAGLVLAITLLLFTGSLLLRLLKFLGSRFSFRHARLQLERKKGRTQLLVIAFGMSLFFLFLILFMGRSLREQLNLIERKDIPNLFAMNVSPELKTRLEILMPEATFVPITQARIVEHKGKEITEGQVPEEGEERFYQTREYVITKRDQLSTGEELVEGASLFGATQEGFVQVSLEESFADRMDAKVGEEFSIDIAGVRLKARVSSLRKVNWFNFQPNFFMVFNPIELEGAPMDFVAFMRVPSQEIQEYQNKIVKEIPQISLVDGEALATRILGILEQLSLAVYSVTLFSLMACVFVFIGIFLARRPELLREVSLWRCLGLRSSRIMKIYAVESLFLGLLASVASFVSALIVVSAMSKWVIDIPVEFIPLVWLLPILILPAALSALAAYVLLRGTFQQSSQSLISLAEEST